MDELEKIKLQKIKELQQKQQEQLQNQAQEQIQLQQQIHQLEAVVKQFLTKEALQRYGNLKTAHPEKSIQLLVVLSQLIQQQKIKGKIEDNLLKSILQQIFPQKKKKFTIKRK